MVNNIREYVRNNRKKTVLIAGIALVIIAFIVITAVIIIKGNGRTASAGNVASKTEATKNTKVTEVETKANTTEKLTETTKEADSEETIKAEQETDGNVPADQDNQSGTSALSGSYYGALQVQGSKLTDASGNAVLLKGMSTHGIAWYPDYINSVCFKELHDNFGINVIRLAMYTAEYNGYCNGGDKIYLKNLIDNGVKYATENNMYAIIDWHILSDGNPNTYISDAKAFFAEMASKYAGNENVLYEICNEPNGGTSWAEIKSYAAEIISVIRQYDTDGIIIVGTPNWSQYVNQAAADPITGYNNIMYALHFYAGTHKDDLRNTMISALDAGLPIFVTEFGICDASGNGAIDEDSSAKWISLMNSRGVSYCMWNLSNKEETSSIFKASCGKVNGFGNEDLSAAGQWFMKMMTGGLTLPDSGNSNLNINSNDSNGGSSTGENSNDNQGGGSSNSGETKSPAASDVNVTANAKAVNSWQADGKTYYQYEVTVTNNSGMDCSSWKVDIIFNENMSLSDNWNGKFSSNGNTIHITSADYNGTLSNGASTGNIGMIISGTGNLKVK